jgi:predicted TIM-barrel fold metal-dependent hydrolase
MADSIVIGRTYQMKASILAQATRRDYLGKLVEKSELLESLHGSDYPHEIPKMLEEMLRKEMISDFSN